jgi:spore maturation protein CgeB
VTGVEKMLGSVFRQSVWRAKEILRQCPPVAAANRMHKASQLRAGLHRLASGYERLAARTGFVYSEERAIAEFRLRLSGLQRNREAPAVGELRIFWVGANRDQDESGLLQALRRIGNVTAFRNWQGGYGQWYWDARGHVRTYDPAIVSRNDGCLVSQVTEAHRTNPLDLLMGQMWANYLSSGALAAVRDLNIPVVNVSMDDRLPENWRSEAGVRLGAIGLAAISDMVLTTSSEACVWYGLEGGRALSWPLASDASVFAPAPGTARDIDVLFIGNKYGIRAKLVQGLAARGVAVACYGVGWPNGPSTAEQSAALFKRAKIVLGIGTVGHCDDVFTLKLRDFDAPMSGALYVTHRNPDLAKLYREGVEIECYSTIAECAQKIHHYLSHPAELSRIADAGQATALARDTWYDRLETTFSQLHLLKRPASAEGDRSRALSSEYDWARPRRDEPEALGAGRGGAKCN